MQETGVHVVNLAVIQDSEGNAHVFKAIDEFCNFVFTKEHKGYTFIAHNSKSYDSQFNLKWCVENGVKPYCIYAGTKIMSMEIQSLRIKFIDSLNFVASALSAFPKTFGLVELKKGYFPHYLNKESNQAYVGAMPIKFREDFIELENIDPLQYVTIASVCMTIYRSNYMPEDTIGVVKDVTRGETYSKISIAWLDCPEGWC